MLSGMLRKFYQIPSLFSTLCLLQGENESVSHSVVSDSLWPHDCSPPGSCVRGILQARILQWVAIPFSRGSSQPRYWTHVSLSPASAGRFFPISATWEALSAGSCYLFPVLWVEGFPCGSAGKESTCNVEDLGSIPGVGKIPWKRERLPTPVFWPGEFHGLYNPWGRRVGHDWVTFTWISNSVSWIALLASVRIFCLLVRWTESVSLMSCSSFRTPCMVPSLLGFPYSLSG